MDHYMASYEERQARAQQERLVKRQRRAIIALTFLASCLLASTIALAVFYARHVQLCRAYMPAEVSTAPTVPEAPPVGRRSSGDLVVVPVVAMTKPALVAPSSKDTIDALIP